MKLYCSIYRKRQKVAPSSFLLFFQQPFGIFIWNFTALFTKTSAQNWMRANCPYFITKKPVAFKFAKYRLSGLSRVGCNVGGLLQVFLKAENNRWSEGSVTGYLGQPATRTDRQSCKRLLKLSDWRLVLEVGAGGGQFKHSQWQWNSGTW